MLERVISGDQSVSLNTSRTFIEAGYDAWLLVFREETIRTVARFREADPEAGPGPLRERSIRAMRRALGDLDPRDLLWGMDEHDSYPPETMAVFEFHCMIIATAEGFNFDRHDPARQEVLMFEVQDALDDLLPTTCPWALPA